jgi:hypothetical protein
MNLEILNNKKNNYEKNTKNSGETNFFYNLPFKEVIVIFYKVIDKK